MYNAENEPNNNSLPVSRNVRAQNVQILSLKTKNFKDQINDHELTRESIDSTQIGMIND